MRFSQLFVQASCIGAFALLVPIAATATTITFASGDYDNAANTVTGTNAAPVYNNNQTTGKFRDVFWWGTAYSGGTKGVSSPDFINAGMNVISNGGSPARARPFGNDTALNFTGQKTTSAGASFLSIYDTTVSDGTLTRNLFDATGGLTISADVLFAPGQHAAGAGIVSSFSEGQDGLALLAFNGGGNNPDFIRIGLISQQSGLPQTLAQVQLPGLTTFVGDTAGGLTSPNDVFGDHWYRIVMSLAVTGDTFSVTGSFYGHSDPADPNSALGALIASVSHSGSLSNPGNLLDLTNPGQIGLMAYTTENFNDGLGTGGTGADPRTDNIGVSITNFTFPDFAPPNPAPEPGTLALLGLGVAGLAATRRRKQ